MMFPTYGCHECMIVESNLSKHLCGSEGEHGSARCGKLLSCCHFLFCFKFYDISGECTDLCHVFSHVNGVNIFVIRTQSLVGNMASANTLLESTATLESQALRCGLSQAWIDGLKASND